MPAHHHTGLSVMKPIAAASSDEQPRSCAASEGAPKSRAVVLMSLDLQSQAAGRENERVLYPTAAGLVATVAGMLDEP